MRSLGQVTIRIPVYHSLLWKFGIDITDHDVSIILGLEHHMKERCSTNEVHKSFTHHPTKQWSLLSTERNALIIEVIYI